MNNNPLSPPPSPSPINPDELTLHHIATGLLHVSQETSRGGNLTLPYPPPLQRGLNLLVLTCLQQGVAPPRSLPDLFEWCRRPLKSWPLTFSEDSVGPQDHFLDGPLPTSLCEAWALATSDVEAELTENHFFEKLITACRAAEAPASYVAFRRLLIEQPVLTALELQQCRLNPDLSLLMELIAQAYEEAPTPCRLNGEVLCCAGCDSLLLRTVSGEWVCENERCRVEGTARPQRQIALAEQPLWLRRGLRRFISAPGRAEIRLEHQLQRLGVEVEMWPAYDRYDLRLTFPDGEVWAVDVKDWANPFLLAHRVKPFAEAPRWHQAFFVFPNERARRWPTYLDAFKHHCTVLNDSTKALYEADFVALAQTKLQGGVHHA